MLKGIKEYIFWDEEITHLKRIISDDWLIDDCDIIVKRWGKKETFEEIKEWLQKKHPHLNNKELEQVTEDFLASVHKITK